MAGADDHRRPGGQQRGGEQVVGDAGGVGADAAGPWPGATTTRSADLARAGCAGSGRRRPTATSGPARTPAPRTWSRRRSGGRRAVRTGTTWAPGVDEAAAHLDRLVGGDAAGDPEDDAPPGEHGMRSGLLGAGATSAGGGSSAAGLGARPRRRASTGDDLVGGDLLEGDRQRLAGHRGDLRRHDGAEALAELAEVGVDLPGPRGAQRDQPELRVRRGRGAPRSAGSSSCRGVQAMAALLSRSGIGVEATGAAWRGQRTSAAGDRRSRPAARRRRSAGDEASTGRPRPASAPVGVGGRVEHRGRRSTGRRGRCRSSAR